MCVSVCLSLCVCAYISLDLNNDLFYERENLDPGKFARWLRNSAAKFFIFDPDFRILRIFRHQSEISVT